MSACPLCLEGILTPLPLDFSTAMRSDGLVLNEPLRKDSCSRCRALIGRNTDPGLPYQRSDGTGPQDLQRHADIANGILREIKSLYSTGPILEVGAASFQTALHLARALPDREVTALEPYPESVPDTDEITIITSPLGEAYLAEKFGLVYANHVLEHVPQPREFLKNVEAVLAPDGIALLSCPNGLVPSHELLFSDHLYHFTPAALAATAEGTGLWLREAKPTPWEPLSQLFILSKSPGRFPSPPEDLTLQRLSYLRKWADAEENLLPALGDAPILFGAGEFSQLIRAYLPKVWARIDCMIVDDLQGAREFAKPVLQTSSFDLRGRVVLLGVHPASAKHLTSRLALCGAEKVLTVFGRRRPEEGSI